MHLPVFNPKSSIAAGTHCAFSIDTRCPTNSNTRAHFLSCPSLSTPRNKGLVRMHLRSPFGQRNVHKHLKSAATAGTYLCARLRRAWGVQTSFSSSYSILHTLANVGRTSDPGRGLFFLYQRHDLPCSTYLDLSYVLAIKSLVDD